MKPRGPSQTEHALTRLEVVVVMFSLFMLMAMLFPALDAAARKRSKIGCTNQLKQLGLSFRIWEGDNNDRYPMNLSVTNGGAMEFAARGNAEAIFQALCSRRLSTPKILVCPADKGCRPATSFNQPLTSSNISYFISPDSTEADPQDIMTGDDNLEIRGVRVKSGLLIISSNTPFAWTAERHGFSGNLGLADGSVQGVNNSMLEAWRTSINATPIRLAIP